MNSPALEVQDIAKWFPIRRGWLRRVTGHVRAVNGVSFVINSGETLGLVGESGCGKSTLARIILQLMKPTRGKVLFQGIDLSTVPPSGMKEIRKDLQIIFQDPFSSLNPRMRVNEIIGEALQAHSIVHRKEIDERVELLLKTVGLNSFHAKRYPHEFSSGQRQRIGIARALAVNPAVVVCDEPVSALDVSIQAQILNLLMDLKEKYQLTYLFISHDLNIVQHISENIAVMYLGKIVEIGATTDVATSSLHPYTRVLMESAPVPDPERPVARTILHGEVPNPAAIPSGCPFHTRCPEVFDACHLVTPVLAEQRVGHKVSCLLYDASWPEHEEQAHYNKPIQNSMEQNHGV